MSDLRELMHALADGELAGEEQARAEALKDQDPRARAEYDTACVVRATLRAKCAGVQDDECWRAVRGRLNELDRVTRTESVVARYSWALCGLFVVAIISAAFVNRMNGGGSVSSEQVASFFQTMDGGGVRTADGATDITDVVREAFSKAPIAAPRTPCALKAIGEGTVNGRRALVFQFRDRQGPFSLMLIENTRRIEGLQEGERSYRFGSINAVPGVSWVDSGVTMLLLAPRRPEELVQVAEAFRIEAR